MSGPHPARKVSIGHHRDGETTMTLTPAKTAVGTIARRVANWLPANKAAQMAVLHNDMAALEKALARGADPNHAPGGTPLLVAAVRRWADRSDGVVGVLLAQGAEPNARDIHGHTALAYCFDVVGVPWKQKNLDGGRAWGSLRPSEKGWFSQAEIMALETDQTLPPRDEERVRSYFRAAPCVLEKLIDAGANAFVQVAYLDLNMKERWPDKTTTAQIAALVVSIDGWHGVSDDEAQPHLAWQRVIKLVAQGLPLERPDHQGFTLLLRAVQANAVDVALALLDAGANPEHQNCWGQTAVTCARNEAACAVQAWQMKRELGQVATATTKAARPRL